MKDETLGMATRKENTVGSSSSTSDASLIKWYDHEAHTHFDVCADDHCQRYQGITRTSTPQAIEAVSSTRERCLYTKEKSVTHVFPNVAAALLKSSKIAGKMSGIHT